MRNYKYSIIFVGVLSLLITSSKSMAYNCTQAPDCASLGYTMSATDCQDKIAVKCPTDSSKVFCKSVAAVPQAALPILYGDGTVTKDIISGKTPIGVVFDETNKLAVALTDVKKDGSAGSENMYWSNNYYDIQSLENCDSTKISAEYDLTPITCGTDGRLNTDAILACGSSCGGTPAATAANSYQPAGCTKDFCKKTKWFLPSIRDLQNIYIAKDQLNTTLTSLSDKGADRINEWYWSSTESGSLNARASYLVNGNRYYGSKGHNEYSVRPVIYYGEPKAAPQAALPILYGDGTVTKEILSGKTPIGVVFDETNKLAVALTDVKKDGSAGSETMYWSYNYYNIQGLQDCGKSEIATGFDLTPITCGVDGRANTDKILACNNNDCGDKPAATAVNSYQPAGCTKDFCKKTKWFLPSIRDLQNIYIAKNQVNTTLTLLSGVTPIGNNEYCSSTEYEGWFIWEMIFASGKRTYTGKSSNIYYVRPVINYSSVGGSSGSGSSSGGGGSVGGGDVNDGMYGCNPNDGREGASCFKDDGDSDDSDDDDRGEGYEGGI